MLILWAFSCRRFESWRRHHISSLMWVSFGWASWFLLMVRQSLWTFGIVVERRGPLEIPFRLWRSSLCCLVLSWLVFQILGPCNYFAFLACCSTVPSPSLVWLFMVSFGYCFSLSLKPYTPFRSHISNLDFYSHHHEWSYWSQVSSSSSPSLVQPCFPPLAVVSSLTQCSLSSSYPILSCPSACSTFVTFAASVASAAAGASSSAFAIVIQHLFTGSS